jgi:hypothetical protein
MRGATSSPSMQTIASPQSPCFAMIHSTRSRQFLQLITALVYLLIAGRAALLPDRLAHGLGYTLHAPNGYSELFAVYVGVWAATAVLAVVAARRSDDPLFGDLLALFVLAQPVGRFLALPFWGVPVGNLFGMFVLEIVGAIALFAVRPSRPGPANPPAGATSASA